MPGAPPARHSLTAEAAAAASIRLMSAEASGHSAGPGCCVLEQLTPAQTDGLPGAGWVASLWAPRGFSCLGLRFASPSSPLRPVYSRVGTASRNFLGNGHVGCESQDCRPGRLFTFPRIIVRLTTGFWVVVIFPSEDISSWSSCF